MRTFTLTLIRTCSLLQEREAAMKDAQARREEMKRYDALRTKNQALSELDEV
jgi:hypothetical protein